MLTLRASDNPAGHRRNIHRSDGLVMPLELILKGEPLSATGVQLDVVLTSHCKEGTIRIEGVVGDGLMEEEVDFWGSHNNSDI